MPSELEDRIRRGQYEDIYRSRIQASTRDPRAMTPDEQVEEIESIQQTMHLAAQRIIELSRNLHVGVRRHIAAEHTPAYITFANAWGRFAGAIQQGIRRSQNVNKIVKRAQQEQRDFELVPPPPPPRRQQQTQGRNPQAATPPQRSQSAFVGNPLDSGKSLNDLMELYGQEIVRDAVRR